MAGLGNKFTEPLAEHIRLVEQIPHHTMQLGQFALLNQRRIITERQIRVAGAVTAELIGNHIVSKAAEQFTSRAFGRGNRQNSSVIPQWHSLRAGIPAEYRGYRPAPFHHQ